MKSNTKISKKLQTKSNFDEHFIKVRGARTHNLKNISLDIPRNKLVVITGLSGSGKSSLAFDTLYAEGQRRYVESLSSYARQFLQLMDKPDVDSVEGLSPAIAIEQKTASHNPRSTVGTVTEIHDYLRLLFARIGTPFCPEHHFPLTAQSVTQITDEIMGYPPNTRLMILSPIIINRKGEHLEIAERLRIQGFVRVRVNGEVIDLDHFPSLNKNSRHNIEIVIDRIKINLENRQRLAEAIETATSFGDGKVIIINIDSGASALFSEKHACPVCSFAMPDMEPRLFSFNSPLGSCPKCEGLGITQFFDVEKIITHPELSLEGGAIRGYDRRNPWSFALIESLAKHYNFSTTIPWIKLTKEIQDIILRGSGSEKINFEYKDGNSSRTIYRTFEGVVNTLERRYKETESQMIRDEMAKVISQAKCPDCGGCRLRKEAANVEVGGKNLPYLSSLSLTELYDFFEKINLEGQKAEISQKIIQEINSRLYFLLNVGLNYLSLSRSAETLSGGEAQRIRLASQIGSGLTGVMYVLDEPSIGLHQRDNKKLLDTLCHLRNIGNSVLVVEHDEEAIRSADHIIDMGPFAGEHGGEVVAQGNLKDIIKCKESLTGEYLSGKQKIFNLKKYHRRQPKKLTLTITNARSNNLKNLNLEIPLGLFICVTGVSGSGKSTLVNDTLYKAVATHFRIKENPAKFDDLIGYENLDKVISIDQSPIGRTPRSNPATYTGVFTPIRELFSELPESKERGYNQGRFSFNVKGGRCEACQGDGLIKVEMHFLSDVYVICDLCKGKRFNRETLEINFRGKNIYDILEMTVEDALGFFANFPKIARKLQTLSDVGLSYIKLGQSAVTLSGGEAQRVKLSEELARRDTGKTLYILDEPTTGLHFHDIELLLKVLHTLVDHGNTVIVIEHNLDVIKTADWIIDLGPDGGDGGGKIIASGTPEAVAKSKQSYTGEFLKQVLKNQ